MYKTFTLSLFIMFLLAACGATSPNSADGSFILATTTSTQDSGLLDVLIPMFQVQSGHTVQTIAVGTGAALRMAEEGNADVLMVHAPPAEEALMAAGYGKDRTLVMHNDFVLIGPAADPANLAAASDAADALARIAIAEAAFVSRGDDSGTHKKELALWASTDFAPSAKDGGWYIESGQGMGSTLFIASEKAAYVMTDRATFLAQRDTLELEILFEGDVQFLNIYHVITVNPDKWPDTNYEAALAFADFLVQDETQDVIATFGVDVYGQPLFFPDAGKTVEELGLK